jgi:CheY-like chemotaxis protein
MSLASRAKPRTILVVDDNRDMVGTTCEMLVLVGYATIPAYSAREACDVLDETRNIDLVLSDVRMPDVDGFDLLRVLRHRYRSLPVILMSGLPLTDEDIIPPGVDFGKAIRHGRATTIGSAVTGAARRVVGTCLPHSLRLADINR